jgi:stage IV sporulation protein FB
MQGIPNHPLFRTLFSLLLYIGIYYILFHDLKSILLLVVVIVIHEAGHFIAMKYYGYGNVKMLFIPLLGAFVSGQPAHVHPVKKMVVLMAGPLPGILIGMICAMIFSHNHQYIYYQLALMFIFLNVFNLLPVSPMDGGQMLETLFFSSKIVVQIIFLVLSAIIIAFLAWATKNYALLLIDIFLLMRISLIGKKKIPREGEELNAEAAEEEIIMSNTGKAAFSILWLLSMVMPLLALIRIMLNK